jgi:hypothetical protein
MIDTERSLETVARLHAEIMRERAEGLHEAAQTAKNRLVAREEALVRLRGQVAMLKASLHPKPAPPKPYGEEASLPRAVDKGPQIKAEPLEIPATKSVSPAWMTYAPYAAIAICAVFLEIGGAPRPAAIAYNLASLVRPAPAVVLNTKAAAKGAPVVVDEDRSQEALLLVHEWKLPGDAKSLGERLGGELEIPGGRPAWTVERTGSKGYRVTFQPAPKDLPYAFEADIESRVVWPTSETQELLAPRFTAAFRDSVR